MMRFAALPIDSKSKDPGTRSIAARGGRWPPVRSRAAAAETQNIRRFAMRVNLSSKLIVKLEKWRASRKGGDEVERERDACMLFGGMGPCLYVTRAGEFLVGADEFFDEPALRAANDNEAVAALVIGEKCVPGLVELVPGPTEGAVVCDLCAGKRWHPLKSACGEWPVVICTECHGRGWRPSVPKVTPVQSA